MRKILIYSADPASCDVIEEALKETSLVRKTADLTKVLEHLKQKPTDIVIIDNDNESLSGIEAFKAIKGVSARARAIMISKAGDISTAVAASKIGVFDFLSKPVVPEKIKEAVEKLAAEENLRGPIVKPSDKREWLEGYSNPLREMLLRMEDVCTRDQDILLVGGYGVPKIHVAHLIHDNSLNRRRKFVQLHLSSFEKESSEQMFWTAIQELLADLPLDLRSHDDSVGTLYLESFDILPSHFQRSILKYLKNRPSEKLDKTIRIVLGVNDAVSISKYDEDEVLAGFFRVDIPSLVDRKEDIPLIIDAFIKNYSATYGKDIKSVSLEVLDFLVLYDWPGNYEELYCVLDSAILKCNTETLVLQDFSLDLRMLTSATLKSILQKGNWSLASAQEVFQKKLFDFVIRYSSGDLEKAAKFLDMPKTVLSEKAESLGIGS